MTIQAVSGKKKFRISPKCSSVVQIQERHGARWEDYRTVATWTEASKLVLKLAMAADETQEMEVVGE